MRGVVSALEHRGDRAPRGTPAGGCTAGARAGPPRSSPRRRTPRCPARPGSSRATASTTASAASSPPVSTKSPRDSSPSTYGQHPLVHALVAAADEDQAGWARAASARAIVLGEAAARGGSSGAPCAPGSRGPRRLDGGHQRLDLHHHPRAAAVGRVVGDLVLALGEARGCRGGRRRAGPARCALPEDARAERSPVIIPGKSVRISALRTWPLPTPVSPAGGRRRAPPASPPRARTRRRTGPPARSAPVPRMTRFGTGPVFQISSTVPSGVPSRVDAPSRPTRSPWKNSPSAGGSQVLAEDEHRRSPTSASAAARVVDALRATSSVSLAARRALSRARSPAPRRHGAAARRARTVEQRLGGGVEGPHRQLAVSPWARAT